jgi:thioredoxin 1
MSTQTIPNDIINIATVADFNALLNKYPEKLLVITFFTDTCSICKSYAPAFAQTQKDYTQYKVIFGRANLEQMPLVSQQFNIMGVPTTIFVKNKEIVHMVSGGFPKSQLKSMVADVLKKFFNVKVKNISDIDTMYM